jgi:RNA polymerase sigma factor (sigma-70 family)
VSEKETDDIQDPMVLVAGVKMMIKKFAAEYARKYHCPHIEDDLVAAATAQLWEYTAKGRYDPARGRYTTWASRVIRTAFADQYCHLAYQVSIPTFHTRTKKEKMNPEVTEAAAVVRRSRSLSDLSPTDGDYSLADQRAHPEASQGRTTAQDILERHMRFVTAHERETLVDFYGLNGKPRRTSTEIARARGTSPNAVTNSVRRARETLLAVIPREELNEVAS